MERPSVMLAGRRQYLALMAAIAAATAGNRLVEHSGGVESRTCYRPGHGHGGILYGPSRGIHHGESNKRKRSIPNKRKTRVRLRAHLRGDLRGRPLTASEAKWLAT